MGESHAPKDGLVQGFYVVNTQRDTIGPAWKTREKAIEFGEKQDAPFAILEVLDEFNNFA